MLQRAISVSRQGLLRKYLQAGVSQSQAFTLKIEEECAASVGRFQRKSPSSVASNGVYPRTSKRQFHSTAISEVEQFTIDVKCLVELQEKATIKFGDNKCFGTRVNDKFEWISFNEFGRLVQKFRNVLVHHNIGKNDKVALISNNRVEWAVAFYAVNGVGGQVKKYQRTILPQQKRHTYTHNTSNISKYYIISYYTISYHTMPYHTISYYTVSYYIMSYDIISYPIMSYYITSYYIYVHHIIPYHISSYHMIS